VDSLDGAYGMQATRAVQGYFIQSNGRLEIRASVLDLANKKTSETFELEGPVTQGTIPLVNALAKKLSPDARVFPTSNESVFRAYGVALAGGDRAAVLGALEKASQVDPRFSPAYLERAQILMSAGDRAAALPVIEAGRSNSPDAIAGARLDAFASAIRGDRLGEERALETLSRLTPADPKTFGQLAQVQLAQRKFSEAVRNYETASLKNPDDTQVLNELGYARSYTGDLKGAKSALEEYQRLESPENVNPLDSLGEVSFYLGDFKAAEKYFFDADRKNPQEFAGVDLLKAAQARLLSGDLAGADVLFQRYAGRENGRGQAAFQKAQWEFLTGRRKAGMAELEKMTSSLAGDGRSLALSQLSVWALQIGDRKAATQFSSQASESAAAPAARTLSALCRVISNSEAGRSGSRLADAYALVFAGKFGEAAPLLEELFRGTDPHNDGEIRTLLAWAYIKTGRVNDARALIGTYPISLSSGESVFASWIFPRYLFVRGAVLQLEGKRAEAKAAYELFLKYSGDVPDAFGDETIARKNLSGL